MNLILQPWQLLVTILAGWINKDQQVMIEYHRTENQVLREILGKKRILLNNDQRRRLAVKGKLLGRKLLEQIGTLFTVTPNPDGAWMAQMARNLTDAFYIRIANCPELFRRLWLKSVQQGDTLN